MDTTLYYTFSTISQTLAGAIALLGAFALFRLQSLNHALEDVSLTVVNCYSSSPECDDVARLHNASRFADVIAFTRAHPFTDPSAKTPYVASRCEQLPLLLAQWKAVHCWLRISLALTVGLIAASVAVLALTPRVAGLPLIASITLIGGWLWLVLCLIAYAKLLGVTLDGEPA